MKKIALTFCAIAALAAAAFAGPEYGGKEMKQATPPSCPQWTRITPHIGWMSDFSWNVVDGSDNNFGMVRSGITFAF